MPHAFNDKKPDPSPRWAIDLVDAIHLLRCEISKSIDEQKALTVWLQCHMNSVTLCDLKNAERRIIQAFQEHLSADSEAALGGLLKQSERTTKKLEQLDAQTPPKSQ